MIGRSRISGACNIQFSTMRYFAAHRKIDLDFLSNLMEYERSDRFPCDCQSNGIPFGLLSI